MRFAPIIKRITVISSVAVLVVIFSCGSQTDILNDASNERNSTLRRSESFFGIHFDLHASENNDQIGKTLTFGMLDSFLTRVKPDFVQIDCKGHGGISSYPTHVGFRAAGYIKDPLKIWREATAAHNVGLYMHYSGIQDIKVAKVYPEWAIVNEKGEKDRLNLSVYSPYSEKILIPQLKELSDVYQVDGAWIDGECWSVNPDYGKEALEEFRKTTGITSVPRNPDDEYYYEFMEFNRMIFKRYVRNYVDAIHTHNPDFQITSNWAFSSLMPDEVDINLDFLSGDLQAQNSVYSAAFEARCLAPHRKPWDLMAWSFSWSPDRNVQTNTKSAVQMMQEAAHVIAMGGGIQFYFRQNSDLSIQPWTVDIMEQLAEFCRERESYAFRAKQIPQVGLIFSTEAYRRNLQRVYSGGWIEPIVEPLKGTLNALLDAQYAVEVLMEHHLDGRMNEYPILVWPEWNYISDEFRKQLLQYVENGGKLLVTGADAVKLFASDLAVKTEDAGSEKRFVEAGNKLVVAGGNSVNVTIGANDNALSWFYTKNDFRDKTGHASAFLTTYGKGEIAAVCFDAGQSYFDWHHFVLRDYFSDVVNRLFPDPQCEVSGSGLVHLTLNEKDGKIQVNLTNVAGNHTNRGITGFDEIPEIGPLSVKLKMDKRPGRIYSIPGNQKLGFTYSDGVVEFKVPEIIINTIVVIDN